MRKLIFLLATALFLLCGCAEEPAESTAENTEYLAAVEIGTSSYSCITGESEIQTVESDTGTVAVKAFSHLIYNPNNEYILTLTSTVTASYSPEENTARVKSVSGSVSDDQMEGFAVSEHISGDTATVILYLNQTSVCHFQYRILTDGQIEFL